MRTLVNSIYAKVAGVAILLMLTMGITATNVSAVPLYATTVNNQLVSFDSENTCSVNSISIFGLQPDEDILGIDFRPSNGALYALGSTSRIYTLNLGTGEATMVGTGPLSTPLSGDAFGFDFNPRANANVGAIRIVSNTGQNLRIHPDTLVVAIDGTLAFGAGDVNAGESPYAVGAAYTNSRLGVMGTALYNIDSALDILTMQNPPNNGTQITIGTLGIGTNDLAGFDIQTTGTLMAPINTAYAAVKETGRTKVKGACGNSTLFGINLTTGAATRIGSIGTNQPIRGFAAPIVP